MISLKRFTSVFLIFIFCLISAHIASAQTWEQVFKKAEKKYAKGKYHKVEKKLKKLRKKHIEKKFDNDSSLYALANLMEAKANLAMAEYGKMEENLTRGLEGLADYQDRPYNYIMGHLRAVDLYNEYGNHRKADSILSIVEKVDLEVESDLLALEMKMRKAFTRIMLGYFNESIPVIDSLISNWSALLEASYLGEEVTRQDVEYKEQMLAELYTAEVEILRSKGEYAKAMEVISKRNKEINRMMDAQTPGYVNFKITEVNTAREWGDLKTADKMSRRVLRLDPPGRLYEKAADASIRIHSLQDDYEGALATVYGGDKALSKSKVSKDYKKLKKDYAETLIASILNEPGKNLLPKFVALDNSPLTLLPLDHPLRTKNLENAIKYITDGGRSESFIALEGLYDKLGNGLEMQYGKNTLSYKTFKVNFAGYYLKYSETPSKAFKLLNDNPQEMVLSEIASVHPDYQRIVDDLMEYYTLTGNFDYPIQLTKQVIESMKQNPNTSGDELGEKMVDLARLQIMAGYYKEAELNADEAMKLIRRSGERKSEKYVKALNSAAYLYGTIGLYSKAERLLKRSESIFGKIETSNKELRLKSIVDLAFLYTRIGEYSETEDLLKEVVKIRSKIYGPEGRLLIKPYSALGELYLISGKYPEAEDNIRKALNISEKIYGDTTLIFAGHLSQLVKLYLELGNYEAALVNAADVLKIREKTLRENHILFADTYTDLGHIHYSLGSDLGIVEKYYTLARDITKTNFDDRHPLYAEALKNLAFVNIQKENFDEALKNLDVADEIWRDALSNKNRSSGEVARLKGDIHSHRENFKEARKEYEKASRYFRKIFSSEHPDYLNTQSRLARSYFINEELKKVESVLSETTQSYLTYTKDYFPTLSEDEKAKFWNKIKPDFEFYNTVAIAYKDDKPKYLENMYDFALATKGLLLNSSIKTRNSILNSGDTVLVNLFKQWISKKEFLTSTLAQSEEELIENEIDVQKLRDEIALLEKELSSKSSDFSNSFEYKFYSWSDIRKSLNDNEAAVEIVRYREFDDQFNRDKVRYAALIITSETKRNPIVVFFEDGKEMENVHFSYHRNATKYKITDTDSYRVYWKPIFDVIGDKKVVFLSPDGVYNQLNVEALLMDDGEFVIDKQNVRIVGNTKTIAAQRSKEALKARKKEEKSEQTLSALLFGNPTYYSDASTLEEAKESLNRAGNSKYVPQLPGTEEEVKTISSLLNEKGWKIEYYLGTNASEDQIKKAKDYTLIHIATHGFFDDKPLSKSSSFQMERDDNPLDRSGLLAKNGGEVLLKASSNYNIEDGVLTAHEAMNLNFENTELIVLSACETGRGEIQQGEGVFGLQRSFLVAGADAIIMSLFQVSDEVTQKLMVEFYNNWVSGQDKRTAFNNAQKTIKKTYRDPIYWGAFTMIAKL